MSGQGGRARHRLESLGYHCRGDAEAGAETRPAGQEMTSALIRLVLPLVPMGVPVVMMTRSP